MFFAGCIQCLLYFRWFPWAEYSPFCPGSSADRREIRSLGHWSLWPSSKHLKDDPKSKVSWWFVQLLYFLCLFISMIKYLATLNSKLKSFIKLFICFFRPYGLEIADTKSVFFLILVMYMVEHFVQPVNNHKRPHQSRCQLADVPLSCRNASCGFISWRSRHGLMLALWHSLIKCMVLHSFKYLFNH